MAYRVSHAHSTKSTFQISLGDGEIQLELRSSSDLIVLQIAATRAETMVSGGSELHREATPLLVSNPTQRLLVKIGEQNGFKAPGLLSTAGRAP
jgi:hypothetical protein